jgi:hypothetical protein
MDIRSVLVLCAAATAMLAAGVAYATAPAYGSDEHIAARVGTETWGALVVAHGSDPEQQAPQQKKHPRVDFTQGCAECHTRRTPAVVEQWQQSRHNPNVGCFICHGDGEVEFNAKPNTDSCMTCHAAKAEDMARAPVQNCFACHNSHRLKFHR